MSIKNLGSQINGSSGLALACITGIVISLSWVFPASVAGAIFGWLAAFLLCIWVLKTKASYLHSFVMGVIAIGLATSWLYRTISYFGGFSFFPSLLLVGLFDCVSALQFVLFLFIFKNMPTFFHRAGCGIAAAWVSAELIFPGLFPWQIGHTQISFLPFIQIADIAGSQLISFMMLWLTETLVAESSRLQKTLAYCAFALSLCYGLMRIAEYSNPSSTPLKVAVIQANISVQDKHDAALIKTNVRRYLELSRQIKDQDTLIIWPESVITEPLLDLISDTSDSSILSMLPRGFPFLVGALTYESKTRYFNTALGIEANGRILRPYHKRILMPFGEFTPFSRTFPYLKELNATAGDFTAGEMEAVFEYKIEKDAGSTMSFKASPLICYEDLVPSMARDSVRAGAELLINLTNDAWYGRSLAPYQHHLIASFRAIENRRFLVRSTNTGLTAIVDPLGRSISSLPIFSEGTIEAELRLLSEKTIYSKYLSNFPFQLLFAFICMGILFRLLRSSKKT